MKIAVLSGKGGTGKTLLSVNLAAAQGEATYVDCDVEEPNGHLFFKPQDLSEKPVALGIPQVDQEKCTGCRVCVDFCAFHALAWVGGKLKVFPEICHSCGGCIVLCPEKALAEEDRVIGRVQRGGAEKVTVFTGILNPGEASGVPIVQELLRGAGAEGMIFIDIPPGSGCIVMETVAAADYCVLVAEPTLFGVHNLKMVWELTKLLGIPAGVVLNKCQEGDNPAADFCLENGIKILGQIPYDWELGRLNSEGRIAAMESPKYKTVFMDLLAEITEEARR